MIKLGLKNYFKGYRYFFVPLGALALGIVLGLSVMIPWCISAIKDFLNGAAALLGDVKWDWDAVRQELAAAFSALDWADPEKVVNEVFTKDYLLDLLKRCAEAALGDTSSIADELERLATDAITQIGAAVAVAFLCTILGAVVGILVTRAEIRHDVAKRKWWKALLASLLAAILGVLVLLFISWLLNKAGKYSVLVLFLLVLLFCAISFVKAYFVHGYKKVPLKQVLSVKNFLLLLLLSVIEIAIAAAMIAVVTAITNVAFGLFVGFSILVITLICLSLNAEAYVKELASAHAQPTEPPATAPTTAEG